MSTPTVTEFLVRHGFDPQDAPYPPLQKDWGKYPIVQCIRTWEAQTGMTHGQTN